MNELVDCGLTLVVRQFAELHFSGLNDAGNGTACQNDAVVGIAGILFLLCLIVRSHSGRNLVSFFACPPVYLFLIHHSGDGLLFQGRIFFLQLIRPELGRFGHLPGAGKLVLSILGTGFGLVAFRFGFLALEVGRNTALVCIVVALLELGVLLFQTADVGKSGF